MSFLVLHKTLLLYYFYPFLFYTSILYVCFYLSFSCFYSGTVVANYTTFWTGIMSQSLHILKRSTSEKTFSPASKLKVAIKKEMSMYCIYIPKYY